jgi:toxin ParE1/3/4
VTARVYRVEWRPMARKDLHGIVRYIANDSPIRARSFEQELRAKTALLARHPEIGRPGRLSGTRELIAHPNYIVLYRVLHEAATVQILRVKHAAQNMP